MNSGLTVTNIRPEAERISRLLSKIVSSTGASYNNILRKAIIWAAQSAAKDTRPGRSSKPSTMADKHRFRPIVKLDRSIDGYFWYDRGGGYGNLFRSKNDISKKSQIKGNISKINRFIEFFNKKTSHFDWMPYVGSAGKYDKTSKGGRIPHAGAAKVGWYGALNKIGKAADGTLDNDPNRLSILQEQYSSADSYIAITNMVDYASKTSPDAARSALQKTENRLVKDYEKRLNMVIAGSY
jgi:hypothetical protein